MIGLQVQRLLLSPVAHSAHERPSGRRAPLLRLYAAQVDEPPLYSRDPGPVADLGFQRDLEERYDLGDRIGRGASCTVCVATDRQTQERCAAAAVAAPALAHLQSKLHFTLSACPA